MAANLGRLNVWLAKIDADIGRWRLR